MELGKYILEFSYILSSILFIAGLKMLSTPKTARAGNLWAAAAMIIAIITTILFHKSEGKAIGNIFLIISAIVIGTILGWLIAKKVKMTAMPQLVSLFNGMGGAAAALISIIEFPNIDPHKISEYGMSYAEVTIILLGLIIGSISFAGSMIAFGKLDGKIKDIKSNLLRFFNAILLMSIIGLTIYIQSTGKDVLIADIYPLVYILTALSLLYGVLFVMPIGGADMPVVISLLNSFTGVAAAMGGFLYDNQAMLTGGILVGSAGTILTILMCRAMNRSLINVILGAFNDGKKVGGGTYKRTVKELTFTDAAILLTYSKRVIIVPGYGLAVAQAQHLCNDLDKLLSSKGVDVKYAIHPVAGRMPGHMNVLLAEADVPYDKLLEIDEVNSNISDVDVCIVIGANDVVNPAAEKDPKSPIYGMPIIKVNEAQKTIVMKRGMGKGYAAIENELFFADKTRMLFGDAKNTLQELISEIKEF